MIAPKIKTVGSYEAKTHLPASGASFTLTMYDAAYLELAVRRQVALATVDKALARAAAVAGIEVLR